MTLFICPSELASPEGGEDRGSPRAMPHVCVIDDDAAMLRALRLLLGAAEFSAETFASAEQFLQSERARRIDCLVVDVQLGGLSGLDLQERLVSSGSRIPIIFITAHVDGQVRKRALQAGAVACLQKPFDEGVLIGTIRKAIGRA